MTDRKGGWIQTYSGGAMYPLDPRPGEIEIVDIAHALSNTCRFGGHSKQFYSVAQHCCLLHDVAPEEHKMMALMHDASEAYLLDMPRPIKRSQGFEFYREAEDDLMVVIAEKFGFQYPCNDWLKETEARLLRTEALCLLSPLREGWETPVLPLPVAILPWAPLQARVEFESRFVALMYKRLTPNKEN
jgi:uncharacterized protein